ncbi:cytochrome P450 750A1-like [Cryptomeria japonica]|uniref:cytochrome P450 750A1-like n=1 Tax=Cryptomeria japonica TaxID=3369 RepID=UPI0027DA97CC|nr:cytochrome P450 750A1-like [Cryptomeria japonica]
MVTPEDCYRLLWIPVASALLPFEKSKEGGTEALWYGCWEHIPAARPLVDRDRLAERAYAYGYRSLVVQSHAVAKISYPEEMQPAFDDDKDEAAADIRLLDNFAEVALSSSKFLMLFPQFLWESSSTVAFMTFLKKYGPTASLKMGSVTVIVISSPEMVKELLKSKDLIFAGRPATAAAKYLFYDFKDVGFTPYGPCWRQMKTLFMVELLNAKRIESMRSMREEAVSLAVRSVWEKSCHGTVAVNLNQIIASLVSSQILRILYGTASDDQGIDSNGEKIKELLLEASMTVGVFNIGDFTGLTGSICKVSSDDD